MKRILISILSLCLGLSAMAGPIESLLERIDPGASKKFKIELRKSDTHFFELDQSGSKVVIRGDSWVNIASGLNWYLKYYAGIHLSWNGMTAELPDKLPGVPEKDRHETAMQYCYDFNYCTFSYSMAFWDWERWEKEIDWMALHGVNLPLAAVGNECVWRNLLLRLGYSEDDLGRIIAGPAFLAWFEMNNLEGWGGPNPEWWYARQEALQKKILARMKEYGMQPVLPGYSGMTPSDAKERLNFDIAEPPLWNGFKRPAVLMPTDARFRDMAGMYYDEQRKLFGTASFYSMDPFHEGGGVEGMDYAAAGKAVLDAMKSFNPSARWVIQGWGENPREEMIAGLKTGDILILDLFSECRPMWGIPSIMQRENGYLQHEWLFCMLENFGANTGLHGRMDQLVNNFGMTAGNPLAAHLKGIGYTMEGIENNPVMFELMSELPWRSGAFNKSEWIKDWTYARYGVRDSCLVKAWEILAGSIYNCPFGNNQQGPHESIYCGRPGPDNFQVSSWSKMSNYYDPADTREAALLILSVADKYRGQNNYEYDLVDIMRQALADRGRIRYLHTMADFKAFDRDAFAKDSQLFLEMLLAQDKLLGTRSEFRLGRWTSQARKIAPGVKDADWLEWNARVQISTWGERECADEGGLRDYAHKEWQGMLKDFYYPRWKSYFDALAENLDGKPLREIDFYAMEEPWTKQSDGYSPVPEGDPIEVAREIARYLL